LRSRRAAGVGDRVQERKHKLRLGREAGP
jgi:hypothetical protein